MTYRVIQWATGGVGRAAIEAILLHPDLELVGCWVHSPEKAGRDVGEIIGREPLGVIATNDVEELLALDADCVHYSPVMANPGEIRRILASGKNVVTPLGWFWPTEQDRAKMEPACFEGGVSLHGTGVDPGGVTEQHPLFFSALTSGVRYVRGEEYSDIRTYNAPDVVRHFMGFGGTAEEALAGPMLELLSGSFEQSVRMCLDTLGFADAEIRRTREVAVATAPIDSPIGTIEPGQVAAQRFAWEAYVAPAAAHSRDSGGSVESVCVVRVGVNWFMGEEHLDPPWTYGEGGERFEVEVKGETDSLIVIHGWHPASIAEGLLRNPGIVVTASHGVNSIPYVCEAEPGIRTFLDLPVVTGRAHPDLAR